MENTGFTRILLATDGSEQAEAAGRAAASFTASPSAAVRVVHVWSLEAYVRDGIWDIETRSEAQTLLTETVMWLRFHGADAHGELVCADRNHVASAVAESARNFKADLVVVGSRGLSDWQSMVKHSVSHRLLTELDCPVLVVRGYSEVGRHQAHRVLLAIAGGDDVGPGVRAATAAASTRGSKALVIHVAQAMFGPQGFAYVEPTEEIQATLGTATAMIRDAGISAEAFAAGSGNVADVVAEAAARWEADVIVIGSSRMGDMASILLGSVTHELLHKSARPVLVAERIAR